VEIAAFLVRKLGQPLRPLEQVARASESTAVGGRPSEDLQYQISIQRQAYPAPLRSTSPLTCVLQPHAGRPGSVEGNSNTGRIAEREYHRARAARVRTEGRVHSLGEPRCPPRRCMTENCLYCERTLPRNDLLENGADR
jgi:hypothetical protein